MAHKPVLSLLLSDDQMTALAKWLDEQHKKRMERQAKPDSDPEEAKELLIDSAIEEICQDFGIEGYEFS